MDKPLWGLRVQAPFGAVGIGTGTWAVLSRIPEGACACGAEGPLALGAKGCVERLHRFAQGPPIGGQDRDGESYRRYAPYTLSRFAGLPLKGKRENRWHWILCHI